MKTILINGIKLIESDQLHNKWIKDTGRLDHDTYVLTKLAFFLGDGNFVDIGANIGTHSFNYYQRLSPGKNLYSFEPNKIVFECLSFNVPNAVRLPFALGEEIALLPLNLNQTNPGASYLGGNSDNLVSVTTLDSLLLVDVSYIKVDVEGFEYFVLSGARNTIATHRPNIWVELNPSYMQRAGRTLLDFLRFIQDLGYFPFFPIGQKEQADVMFIHASRLEAYQLLLSDEPHFKEMKIWIDMKSSERFNSLEEFFGSSSE
jgi:FkbM family methyltransferase